MKDDINEASKNPEALVLEAVHSVGYKGGLANPLLAQESSISRLDSEILEEFVAVSLIVTLSNFSFVVLVSCCIVNHSQFEWIFFRKIILLLGWC